MTRIPSSTYRLQLHAGFPFQAAMKILPYLARLGVTDVYLSPIWASTPGSMHGYDVTDHTRVNDELGGEAALRRFATEAHALGLGLIVDFVPNHMGIGGGHNRYWEDVLMHGQGSRYAHFFDIDWQPLKRGMQGKVLLPFLGDQYGRVLDAGQIQLERNGGQFTLRLYGERSLPLAPGSLGLILRDVPRGLPQSVPAETREEMLSVIRTADTLLTGEADPNPTLDAEARSAETAVMTRRLHALAGNRAVARALDDAVQAVNTQRERLDALIAAQHYRLAYWKVAAEEINYRRFFDINDLAALRMEDPRVFEWAHAKLLNLLHEGVIQGIRLDHTDGLHDPAGYFQALQAAAGGANRHRKKRGKSREERDARRHPERPLYVVAEKILEPGEALPDAWAVYGTTGYDFLAELNGVFVDEQAEKALTATYRSFTGDDLLYEEHLYHGKQRVQRVSLASEVNVLAEQLERLSETDLEARDFTLATLRDAIREVIACFPVYRTYLRRDGKRETVDDERVSSAIRAARDRNARTELPLEPGVFDFLRSVLTLTHPDPEKRARYAEFTLKFQQLTGPVTAKGAEDTAFYRAGRLLSLNEVGGDPGHFGTPLRAFHEAAAARAAHWPAAMLAGSTHDTKRGEDTRARLHVLSEVPDVWNAFLTEWTPLFEAMQTATPAGPAPTFHDVNTILQNALGAYPLQGPLTGFPERLAAYMQKAAREAKLRTDWSRNDPVYEAALESFTLNLLRHEGFMAALRALHDDISPAGVQNSLSATLVRLTAPGVPDTYQGCEGWNQSLVDPDNRQPVDYARLKRGLTQLEGGARADLAQRLLRRYETGEVKQLVTWAALQARAEHRDLFHSGTYTPLDGGKHLVAFAREFGKGAAVTVAPRLTRQLTQGREPWATGDSWGQQTLNVPRPGRYRNVLTGETLTVKKREVPVARILASFPLALLVCE